MVSASARRPRILPDAYVLLSNWRYVEYGLLRVIAGWGRAAGDWEDKLAVCYHTWLQAEIVERLRRRLDMFPGGKKEPAVHAAWEGLMNAVLLAPNWNDAMAGVHHVMNPALVEAYSSYAASAHPVHDRPTFELVREVLDMKRQQAEWYADFSRRHPHVIDAKYEARIRATLAALGNLVTPVEPAGDTAMNCGARTDFRMQITPGRVKNWDKAPNLMPLLEVDWSHNVEARRLYFMIGYCAEMGVAEQQLRWIYHADFMPFEFIYAESRHMWDESRHGNSGYQRLKDFGLDFEHFGYNSYGLSGEGILPPMTPKDVYEAFYGVTQIAETGYFETKRYCFEDFLHAGDDASAEMMQYDIIDETSHVEYGRIWLNEIAAKAGVQEDYRKRGLHDRNVAKAAAAERAERFRRIMNGQRDEPKAALADHGGNCVNPCAVGAEDALTDERTKKHYHWMLAHLRDQVPLRGVEKIPARPSLPM